MKIKNSQFHRKAIAFALAFVFQPTMLLAQVNSNSVAQDNINHAVQAPKAQAEFALPSKQVGQTTFVLPDLGDSSSASLSFVDERKLGQEIMREIRRDPDYSSDPVVPDYLNGLAQQLIGPANQLRLSGFEGAGSFSLSFELFALRDKSINAFALPGGYIGVHTGLIVAAETESELASVLGHEMGHVSQKHIARMYGKEGTNSMIALASIVLAILAARNNPNVAQGLAVGGQALAIQNQLSYSRDAEREADRVGFQILQASGFDVQGMPDFFQRMQRANSIMENGVPGYLRTHPLTTDRIADMQDRVRGLAVRKVPLSIEFYLLKARARLIQTSSSSNYPELRQFNESLTHNADLSKQLEGYYGLTLLNMKQERWTEAESNLQKTKNVLQAMSAAGSPVKKWSLALEATSIDLMVMRGQNESALKELNLLKSVYPNSRTFNLQTINIQLKLKQYELAIAWMKAQLRVNPDDAVLWDLLAKAYNLTGKKSLQYAALAEKYVSNGAWIAAVEQIRLAKEAGDADFYQASEIEARARQIQEMYRQELREKGKKQ